MSNKVDMEFITLVKDNYPEAWEWMKHKANWEHIPIGAVANDYKNYIEKLINKGV